MFQYKFFYLVTFLVKRPMCKRVGFGVGDLFLSRKGEIERRSRSRDLDRRGGGGTRSFSTFSFVSFSLSRSRRFSRSWGTGLLRVGAGTGSLPAPLLVLRRSGDDFSSFFGGASEDFWCLREAASREDGLSLVSTFLAEALPDAVCFGDGVRDAVEPELLLLPPEELPVLELREDPPLLVLPEVPELKNKKVKHYSVPTIHSFSWFLKLVCTLGLL